VSDPLTTLAVLLKNVGWSDGDLARRVGCSRQLIERIRAGRITASPRARREIAVVLGREGVMDVDGPPLAVGVEVLVRRDRFRMRKGRVTRPTHCVYEEG
jgi:transcriptional regulator with XRE-family HTH domain